jgi:hypothetical protein
VKRAGGLQHLATAMVAAGCAGAPPPPPASPQDAAAESGAAWRQVTPKTYDAASMWVCRPDLPADACRGNRDATELRADGSEIVVPFVPSAGPTADCFYVYPTVDLTMTPGNHTDFSDTDRMREWTFGQVARFGETCRLFVPLYRQMTFGTYFGSDEEHARRFDLAYADVLASFRWYLAHSDASRPLVLVGHSQGAQMIEKLLQSLFDGEADTATALRARLLVAMPIGGDVQVADGSLTGGTFQRIPLCASQDDLGCVVAFGTFLPKGSKNPWPGAPPKGKRRACVNPVAPGDDGSHLLSGAVYPTHSRYRDGMPNSRAGNTPFLVVPDFYTAQCVDGADGFRYLAVDEAHAPGDARPSPVSFDWRGWKTRLGLHVLDFQLAQRSLSTSLRHPMGEITEQPGRSRPPARAC